MGKLWETFEYRICMRYRDKSSLSEADPTSGKGLWINKDDGKVPGPSGLVLEMVKWANELGISMIATEKADHCSRSYSSRVNAYPTVNCCKGKGDYLHRKL